MKKTAIALGFILLLASAAMADQVRVGYSGSPYGPYQTGIGGEFTLTPTTGWLDLSHYGSGARDAGFSRGSFQTFCLEGGENIYPFNSVYNAVIQRNAQAGGVVGPAGDPLSVGTGWLYSQFASGNWQNGVSYRYNNMGRRTDADLLQKAIWWLEGEERIGYDQNNKYMAAVVARFGGQAEAKADGGWLFGVYALHLTTANGGPVQDQLYFGGFPVPDGGATVMLLGFAMAGLGYITRKLRV